MAERRMFAKTIIDSDTFLDMPLSAQALYFHLSMRADDEGFVNNPKKIQRLTNTTDDDFRILVGKNFLIPFDSGILVIKHWKIHNYIRGDRKHETTYQNEMELLTTGSNGEYFLKESLPTLPVKEVQEESAETLRQIAYKNSSLPYSFNYKVRNAFVGKKCPLCGCTMNYANNLCKPTIQHNIPISKGGEHELGNISVVCNSCNSSYRDTETGTLNALEVIDVWDSICQSNVSQMSVKCQSSVSIGKDNKDNKNNINVHQQEVDDMFESLWSLYVRKEGKSAVSKKAKEEIFKVGYDRMKDCIERYAREKKDCDKQYILMGSTFFNGRYKDYLKDDVPVTKTVQSKLTKEEDDDEPSEEWTKQFED